MITRHPCPLRQRNITTGVEGHCVQREQDHGQIHRIEAQDVLAHDLEVRWPATLEYVLCVEARGWPRADVEMSAANQT
jgi:hypothetical protein